MFPSSIRPKEKQKKQEMKKVGGGITPWSRGEKREERLLRGREVADNEKLEARCIGVTRGKGYWGKGPDGRRGGQKEKKRIRGGVPARNGKTQ